MHRYRLPSIKKPQEPYVVLCGNEREQFDDLDDALLSFSHHQLKKKKVTLLQGVRILREVN